MWFHTALRANGSKVTHAPPYQSSTLLNRYSEHALESHMYIPRKGGSMPIQAFVRRVQAHERGVKVTCELMLRL